MTADSGRFHRRIDDRVEGVKGISRMSHSQPYQGIQPRAGGGIVQHIPKMLEKAGKYLVPECPATIHLRKTHDAALPGVPNHDRPGRPDDFPIPPRA